MKTSILNSNRVMDARDHFKNGANPKGQMSRRNNFRKVLFLACFAVFASVCMAQDIIVTKDSKRINAKVTEVNEDNIKYKNFDNPDGPVYTLSKANILTIVYQNGLVETFEAESSNPVMPAQTVSVQSQKAAATKTNNMAGSGTNTETVFIPKNAQSSKDVIIRRGTFNGVQTTITQTSRNKIYYVKYKNNGREKGKKIKQKKVAYTLSFDNKIGQEMYPLQMDLQDFLSLPTYNNFVVFGTNNMTNLSYLKKTHPDIHDDFVRGKRQFRTGSTLSMAGALFLYPLMIPGFIIQSSGSTKMVSSFENYYSNCVDMEVCSKYGISITPYNTSLTFK